MKQNTLIALAAVFSYTAVPISAQTVPTSEPWSDSIFPEDFFLDTNLEYSKHVLSLQRGVTDRAAYQLNAFANGELQTGKLYLSGHLSFSHYNERTDTAGKFPILGRFPDQHTTGKSADESIIDNINLSLTYAANDWVSIYLGGIYTELEFPHQDDKQLREASITIGNLKKTPFYLSVGRKTVNFGNMQAYNPTTHTVTNHYYRTDTDDLAAEFGYLTKDWHLTFTAIDGNRQLRVADSTSDGSFGNFALSAQRNFNVCDWDISVGAGYLNSTIYDSDAANHPGVSPDPLTMRDRNGAYDFWVEAKKDRWSFMAEYTQTERAWPATGRSVQALTLQAAYDTELWSKPTRFSVAYGRGQQGYEDDAFHELEQLAAGMELWVTPNFSISAEYVYNRAFVPLIMISRVSDPGVDTHTFIISGKVFF
ncbi:MAG: LbtU family siderophore porin [Akkermansiaceae bacterium]|nr:LbtU family siderophore porin [Akkermansiaceae bacterium]